MVKMNLMMLLERLQEFTNSNIKFAGKVLVDREELQELVEKIIIAFPEELKQAEFISRQKENYMRQAREEAERIIREAEGYAEQMIRQDRILIQAENEARRIIDEARNNADEIERSSKEYAADLMGRLEESLGRTLTVVRRGREGLTDNMKDDDSEEYED